MKQRQKIRKGLILFSFFLFPATFYYLSPVIVVQSTLEGIVNGSLIVFVLMFISAFVLGRAFCGWVCPGAGCQEAIFAAREKKVTSGDFIKWIIWVPWVAVIAVLALRRGGYEKIDFLYQTRYGLSIGDVGGLIAYLCVLLILIVLPAFIFGKRSFCHHLCWMAPFMILGRKIGNGLKCPALKLKVDSNDCIHCQACTRACPMCLPVEKMVTGENMQHTECILCGTCIDGCASGVIHFVFNSRT